jgi:hypothetical protein
VHPPDSFPQNKQITTHLDGVMRAHMYPSVLLKNARNNDTTVEGLAGRLLQCAGAWGLLLHSDLANGQKLKARGHRVRLAVTQKTLHSLDLKPLKGYHTPPRPRGLHLMGVLSRTHRTASLQHKQTTTTIGTCSQAYEGVLHSFIGSRDTVGYH